MPSPSSDRPSPDPPDAALQEERRVLQRRLAGLASEFDDMMRTVAAKLWCTSPAWSQAVDLQVRLPLRWGGMGLRPIAEIAP